MISNQEIKECRKMIQQSNRIGKLFVK